MVNVIVPVYKARDTLAKLFLSLCAQVKRQFCVTCIQDADGENYDDILDTFENLLDITWISCEVNGGPGNARQIGIDNTPDNFDYVMFADADDMFNPRAIEILTMEANRNQADIVMSALMREKLHDLGHVIGEIDSKKKAITWTHGKIYRLKFLREKNIRFHPDLFFNEDSYFNALAFAMADRIFQSPEITYLWRENPNSLTANQTYPEQNIRTYTTAQLLFLHELCVRELPRPVEEYDGTIGGTLLNIYQFLGGDTTAPCEDIERFGFDYTKILDRIYSGSETIVQGLIERNNQGFLKDKIYHYYPITFEKWLEEVFKK